MADGSQVSTEGLDLAPQLDSGDEMDFFNLWEVRQRAEGNAVRRPLALASGDVSRVVDLLGVARPTHFDLMERAGISTKAC